MSSEIEKSYLFIILGILQFSVIQKKNYKANSYYEITNNNLTLYMMLIISLAVFLVLDKCNLKTDNELLIQLIFYVITIV